MHRDRLRPRDGARAALAVLAAGAVISSCGFVGRSEVRVESGNQATGFLSRPMSATVSSDETIQEMAQNICDHVRPRSTAKVTYVGKTEGDGPVNLVDWGRYRYDCELPVPAVAASKAPAPAVMAAPMAPAPATPAAASTRASLSPEAQRALESPPGAPGALLPAPPSSPPPPASVPAPAFYDQHARECLMQKGAHFVCVGNCMMRSSNPPAGVQAECEQICPPASPPGCP